MTTLNRLSRRGKLTITAADGHYQLHLKAPGPYLGRAWCTSDEADFWQHCHLGATTWYGEGPDLDVLLAECEEVSRPRYRDVDDLRWEIERRRESRTLGPPLPSFIRWNGWRPGDERWLRTFSHAREYLGGYERDLEVERKFETEQVEQRERLRLPQVPRRATRAS